MSGKRICRTCRHYGKNLGLCCCASSKHMGKLYIPKTHRCPQWSKKEEKPHA